MTDEYDKGKQINELFGNCDIITIAEASKLRLGFFWENKHSSMMEYLSIYLLRYNIYLSIYISQNGLSVFIVLVEVVS